MQASLSLLPSSSSVFTKTRQQSRRTNLEEQDQQLCCQQQYSRQHCWYHKASIVDHKGDYTESGFIHSNSDAVQAARCIELWSYGYGCCERRYTKTRLTFSGAGAQQSSFPGSLRQGLIHTNHITYRKNLMGTFIKLGIPGPIKSL